VPNTRSVPEVEVLDAASAMPKSATLASPASSSSTFWGFMSRCTMQRPWAAPRASATCEASRAASAGPSVPPLRMRSLRLPPGTCSIAM
jgi:hypothetical protein